MDSNLLLVKSITLIYRESQLTSAVEFSSGLIKEVLATIKAPDLLIEGEFGRDVISALRSTLNWMLETPVGTVIDKTELLQRIRVNVKDEESLYHAVLEGIEVEMDEFEIRKSCQSHRECLRTHMDRLKVETIIGNASIRVKFQKEGIDWRHFVRDVLQELEPYSGSLGAINTSSVVDDFDLGDVDAMTKGIRQGIAELSSEGVLKFGLQGVNRMFGDSLGIRRGEFLVIPALQHNFKSGFTLTLMKQMALYNTPWMRDTSKKPMILRITTENKATDDILWLYKSLVENETGIEVDLRAVDAAEASAYVSRKLQATGYNLRITRVDPSAFTYRDLDDLIDRYEAEGYEIHALFIDYMPMFSKKGCDQGPAGTDMRDLYRRVRNITSRKGIACITPHQLSTEAKMLVRNNIEDFVQEIANKGYYDGCRTVDQEVDMEIYIHIVKINGESYLTIQRGKHRKVSITRASDLYCVYKFDDIGAIKDDITGKDMSRKKVGGSTMSEGGNSPWFS